jgi:hypothetical protein
MGNLKHLEKEVDSSRATVLRLEGDQTKAQEAATEAQEHLRSLWLEGADAKQIASAEGKAAAKQYTLTAVSDALKIARERAADAERNLALAHEATAPEKKAQELREQCVKLEAAWTAPDQPLQQLLAVLQESANADAVRWANEVAAFREAMGFGITSIKGAYESMAVATLQGASEQTEGARVVGLFRAAIGVR